MAIIDMIFKLDEQDKLEKISCLGESKQWLEKHSLSDFIGEKIEYMLGTSLKTEGGIIEIKNKVFKYQWVEEAQGATIFLSCDGVLLDLYEQAINNVSEGMQIYDKNGFFLHGNPSSEKLENYSNKEFKGKHVLDIYNLKEEISTTLTVLRTQNPVINRCDRFQMRNGKNLTTINSGYPLKIDGNLYGAVAFESDLSVLKQIQNRTNHLESYVESKQQLQQNSLYTFEDIVHVSDAMKDMIHFAKKISFTSSNILLVGATGTGKELIAQSIHSFGTRRNKPFIDVNCSAVPSNLFESMFFGTEKGAFTGSVENKGFFEMASGGTLFLDEVNSISVDLQAKLLRVLQDKRVQRIGGSKYISCDVRIIAASNEDPFDLMKQGKIRKDLYYRIATIKMDLIPLQDRKEDIPVLTEYFLLQLCNKYNRQKQAISQDVFRIFYEYDWPGNVRELQNVIEYGFECVPEDITMLEPYHLPQYLQSPEVVSHRLPQPKATISLEPSIKTFEVQMEYYEQKIISETLTQYKRNVTQCAKALGISRQSLQYRMKKLELTIK
jgi:arginine utilization regulatory protein